MAVSPFRRFRFARHGKSMPVRPLRRPGHSSVCARTFSWFTSQGIRKRKIAWEMLHCEGRQGLEKHVEERPARFAAHGMVWLHACRDVAGASCGGSGHADLTGDVRE